MKENKNFTPCSTDMQENEITSGGQNFQKTSGDYA